MELVLRGKWFSNSTPQLRAWRSLVALLAKAELCASNGFDGQPWQDIRAGLFRLGEQLLQPQLLVFATSISSLVDAIVASDGQEIGYSLPSARAIHDRLLQQLLGDDGTSGNPGLRNRSLREERRRTPSASRSCRLWVLLASTGSSFKGTLLLGP